MALTTQGKYSIADAIIGGTTYNKFSVANAHIIVGTGTGAAAVGDTVATFSTAGMTGSNVKACSSVTRGAGASENVVTFAATFTTTEANGAWNEWGVTNAVSGGRLLNRKQEALGTKTNTQTWVFTVDITFGA